MSQPETNQTFSIEFDTAPPPPAVESEYAHTNHIARRAFLGTSLKIAGGLLVAGYVDRKIGQYFYGGTQPTLEEVSSPEVIDTFPTSATVIWAGFNVAQPITIAEALMPTLNDFGRTYVVNYAPNGIQTDDLGRLVHNRMARDGITTVNHYAHSMGGMVAVETAVVMQQAYGLISNFINLDCSPGNYMDVRGVAERLAVASLAVVENLDLHGGPMEHTALDGLAYGTQHGMRLDLIIAHELQKARPHGSISADLAQSEAGIIHGYRSLEHLKHLTRTVLAHVGPTHGYQDRVVNDPQAIERSWSRAPTGLIRATSTVTGHADPSSHPKEYNRMLRQNMRRAGLADREDLRRTEVYAVQAHDQEVEHKKTR